MGLINNQYVEEETWGEDGNSVTYVIEIRNFINKLGKARFGQQVESDKFFVNWSKFKVKLYIAGDDEYVGGYVSLYVCNESDWMVRARSTVSVNSELLGSEGPAGKVYESVGDTWGWGECIPHSRCVMNDLLTHDGVLRIKVRVEVLAEKTPGGVDGRAGHKELILTSLLERLRSVENKLKGEENNASQDLLNRLDNIIFRLNR